jgi:diketogulonate reductase-like aldo/keto reductase
MNRTVTLPDGSKIPALGQGTWQMGEHASDARREAAVLREGIERGLTLIDTAEMYADGGSERVVGRAIASQRDRVFLVSKVSPQNASTAGIAKSAAASLQRLGTDYLDLYLLHWPGRHPLEQTVAAFEKLRAAGTIRYWGVSNFDTDLMTELAGISSHCATDQILYHPDERGPEFDLLPWCREHRMPIMAYSPLGQGGRLLRSPALAAVARRHNATPAQIAIAWAMRDGTTIAIPKTASQSRVAENAAAAAINLTAQDLAEIDASHKPPRRKQRLGML